MQLKIRVMVKGLPDSNMELITKNKLSKYLMKILINLNYYYSNQALIIALKISVLIFSHVIFVIKCQ